MLPARRIITSAFQAATIKILARLVIQPGQSFGADESVLEEETAGTLVRMPRHGNICLLAIHDVTYFYM